jgi:hypothetical protein
MNAAISVSGSVKSAVNSLNSRKIRWISGAFLTKNERGLSGIGAR